MTAPKYKPGVSPDPERVKALRERHDLTQEQAAALVYAQRRTWQDWERGVAVMHPGLWELFCVKVGAIQLS